MEKTTIQISQETLNRLKMLKNFNKQSYDDVLNSLIDNIQEETLSDEEIEDIKKSLEDIKKGRLKTIEDVAKELGVTLK